MSLRERLTDYLEELSAKRLKRRLSNQRREVTRLELAYRLDQAERMNGKQSMAHAKEIARFTRQLDTLRNRLDEALQVIGSVRIGVQVLAVQDALTRAQEAAASGFGELEEEPNGEEQT